MRSGKVYTCDLDRQILIAASCQETGAARMLKKSSIAM
jgi:hypothetical protein